MSCSRVIGNCYLVRHARAARVATHESSSGDLHSLTTSQCGLMKVRRNQTSQHRLLIPNIFRMFGPLHPGHLLAIQRCGVPKKYWALGSEYSLGELHTCSHICSLVPNTHYTRLDTQTTSILPFLFPVSPRRRNGTLAGTSLRSYLFSSFTPLTCASELLATPEPQVN